MTSERQETEQAFERWYNHAFATRGVDTKHMNDCEDAFEAGRTLALRATPRAVPDETREAVAWGIWHYNGDLVGLKRTKDEAERWCEGSATYGPPRPLYAHPPRAGEVTEAARDEFFGYVSAELDRAYAKLGREPWGRHEFFAILKEEVDELWDDIKADAPDDPMYKEMVQVAAMCFRFFETGGCRYRRAALGRPS